MTKRQWGCERKLDGFILYLRYDDLEFNTFMPDVFIFHTLDPTSAMCSKIRELNRRLSDYLFPLKSHKEYNINLF